jgi:hypothetical protein
LQQRLSPPDPLKAIVLASGPQRPQATVHCLGDLCSAHDIPRRDDFGQHHDGSPDGQWDGRCSRTEEAGDRVGGFLELDVGLVAPLAGSVNNAVGQVLIEQAERD